MIDKLFTLCFAFVLLTGRSDAQSNYHFETNFDSGNTNYETIGRGTCTIIKDATGNNGILQTKKAYARFGQSDWKNYSIRFSARNPDTADQVQIWAGFRAYNRDDRYIIGLRGGMQNNVYLSRQGYMGTDEFLALRPRQPFQQNRRMGEALQIGVLEMVDNRFPRMLVGRHQREMIAHLVDQRGDDHAESARQGRRMAIGFRLVEAKNERPIKCRQLAEIDQALPVRG